MSPSRLTLIAFVAGMTFAGTALAQSSKAASAPAAGSKAASAAAGGTSTMTQKLADCNKQAKSQHLKRKAKRAFMDKCSKE